LCHCNHAAASIKCVTETLTLCFRGRVKWVGGAAVVVVVRASSLEDIGRVLWLRNRRVHAAVGGSGGRVRSTIRSRSTHAICGQRGCRDLATGVGSRNIGCLRLVVSRRRRRQRCCVRVALRGCRTRHPRVRELRWRVPHGVVGHGSGELGLLLTGVDGHCHCGEVGRSTRW